MLNPPLFQRGSYWSVRLAGARFDTARAIADAFHEAGRYWSSMLAHQTDEAPTNLQETDAMLRITAILFLLAADHPRQPVRNFL